MIFLTTAFVSLILRTSLAIFLLLVLFYPFYIWFLNLQLFLKLTLRYVWLDFWQSDIESKTIFFYCFRSSLLGWWWRATLELITINLFLNILVFYRVTSLKIVKQNALYASHSCCSRAQKSVAFSFFSERVY